MEVIFIVFNKNILGLENEIEFVKCFDGVRVKELNIMHLMFIQDLFGEINESNMIKCWKNERLEKSDIFISINGEVKGVSIKKGIKNSVHVERISDFIHFLIENKIDKHIVMEYLKYHYADGTTNGTGEVRLPVSDYKKANQDKIDLINDSFNNLEILNKIVDRFILMGRYKTKPIDVLLYGVIADFIWIKSDDIRSIILSKAHNYSTSVHFGPLTCQPMDRCLNKNSKYESKRFCVQIKWYNLGDDIIENMNNKCVLMK